MDSFLFENVDLKKKGKEMKAQTFVCVWLEVNLII